MAAACFSSTLYCSQRYYCRTLLTNAAAYRACSKTDSNTSSFSHNHGKINYEPEVIESKWQDVWQNSSSCCSRDNSLQENESKHYVLSMFPYPSGKLHMGHVRVYTISDTLARYHRMKGKKVLHPMGWDSFGLPAENAAIDKGINPSKWTNQNIAVMKQQLLSLGCQFDWNREISTCSPEYYRWTQWLFLQLHKHGLAYKKKSMVNWDPVDQTVLANEQVDAQGNSWRSGAKVMKKELSQWYIRTSDFAEDLLQGLEDVDWSSQVKVLQSKWIGKSEGAYFDFKVQEMDGHSLRVFTTRPETVFGVSFVAISVEHDICRKLSSQDDELKQKVDAISLAPRSRKQFNTGVNLNLTVVHPLTGKVVPVVVADYVVNSYGTHAVMGVAAHDARDRELASHLHLPVWSVLDEDGRLMHSEQFSGLSEVEGAKAIVAHATSLGVGGTMTQYRLQDWLVSRQRYWGTPIPILYCDKCGVVPVPEDQLPVVLPTEHVQLTGRGLSPLTHCHTWQQASCGKPGCCARREMDTLDTFVDSSWYFLRFINSRESAKPFNEDVLQWMPVDIYIGGIEHATLHLFYARFIAHFLCKIGLLETKEPFKKLLSQGMVEGQTFRVKSSSRYLTKEEQTLLDKFPEEVEVSWEKMSKSKHNGVDPQEVIDVHGADVIRLFMLFKAPPEMSMKWEDNAIHGMSRWFKRVWSLCQKHVQSCQTQRESQQSKKHERLLLVAKSEAINKVTDSLDNNIFNVAISSLMIFSNSLKDLEEFRGTPGYHDCLCTLCVLLAPMAPHISSELWQQLGAVAHHFCLPSPQGEVLQQTWPESDSKFTEETVTELRVMVNGKLAGSLASDCILSEAEQTGSLQEKAVKFAIECKFITDSNSVNKVVVVPKGNIINIVTNKKMHHTQ